MTTAISPSRWRFAQEGQLRHQRKKRASFVGHEASIVDGAMRHSERVHGFLDRMGHLRDGVVVEVGAGAHGLIWRWPSSGVRIGVDPLARFYRREFGFLQEGEVASIAACGEELPVASESVDLLLSDNVLDHVADPRRFLRECRRALKTDGRMYFTVDSHHAVWRWGARAYNRLHDLGVRLQTPAFPNHPFHFTRTDIEALLGSADLATLYVRVDPPRMPSRKWARSYDIVKRAFFKNARMEIIAARA